MDTRTGFRKTVPPVRSPSGTRDAGSGKGGTEPPCAIPPGKRGIIIRLEYVPVGRIVNAHGVRGELRVLPLGQPPAYLTRFKTFFLDGKPVEPLACHVHKGGLLLRLPGINDRDAALALKEHTLFVRRSDADPGPLEAFNPEYIGGTVLDAETGETVGIIEEVTDYPAGKVLTVRGDREYLIPAVPEVFVQSLDLDAGRMTVHMLEGLATDAD